MVFDRKYTFHGILESRGGGLNSEHMDNREKGKVSVKYRIWKLMSVLVCLDLVQKMCVLFRCLDCLAYLEAPIVPGSDRQVRR